MSPDPPDAGALVSEEETYFCWAAPDELDALLAAGWQVCAGWRNAAHHLRYTLPLWRVAP